MQIELQLFHVLPLYGAGCVELYVNLLRVILTFELMLYKYLFLRDFFWLQLPDIYERTDNSWKQRENTRLINHVTQQKHI